MPELYNEGADALTSSVSAIGVLKLSMCGQCLFYRRDCLFEQMSCRDAFLRSNNSGGGSNGIQNGVDGQGLACSFDAVK